MFPLPFFMNNFGLPQGWVFSASNSAILCNNPWDEANMMWNLANERTQAARYMYCYPAADSSFGIPFGLPSQNDCLLNPNLALEQAKYNNNGNNIFGMSNVFGMGNNGFNFDMSNPWGTSFGNTQGGSSNPTTETGMQVKKLKDLFNRILKQDQALKKDGKSSLLTDAQRERINKALKEGKTDEEKLEALQKMYKSFSDKKLFKKAIASDDDFRKQLKSIGYDFGSYETNAEKKDRKTKQKLLEDIYTELNMNTSKTETEGKNTNRVEKLASSAQAIGENIIEYTSLWNQSHNKSMIDILAEKLPSSKSERVLYETAMTNLSNGLINKAKEVIDDKSMPKLEAAKTALSDALEAAKGDKLSKSSMEKVSKAFNALYAQIRMTEAARVNAAIKEKYGFMNEIDGQKVFSDDFIKEDIKRALEKEGITDIPDVDISASEIEEDNYTDIDDKCETPEEKVNSLIEKNHIKKSSVANIYESKSQGEKKFYTIKKDSDGEEQLVELKNVKSVAADGTCTLYDGTKKPASEVETFNVSAQNVVDYKKAMDKVNSLIASGSIYKIKADYEGHAVYASKGKDENGKQQFFVVKDNRFVELSDVEFKNNKLDTKGKSFDNAEVEEISDSQILTENKKEKKVANEKKSEEETNNGETAEEKIIKEDNGAYDLGYDCAEDLIGITNEEEHERVKNALACVNKDNVLEFLEGYYSNSTGGNGLFLQLALESGDNGKFDNKLVNKVIRAALDAVPDDLKSTEEFKEAQRICRKCERRTNGKFKMLNSDWGWGWNRFWGKDDLDQLDDAFEALFGLGGTTQVTPKS